MQAAQVIPFSFESHEVRTLLINNEPWFVAADVCASLSIGNVSLAVNGRADRKNDGLDDDEKGIATVNTPFGDQQMLVVSESGLYALIFKSRKKEAKHFQKWVTAEVLPAIRKHGRYEDTNGKMDSLLGQTIGTDGLTVLSNLVAGKVNHLTRQNQRRATMKLWAQVQAAFNVRSVEDLPADQLNEARTFIAAYVLEGEYLGKEEAPKKPEPTPEPPAVQGIVLNEEDFYNFCLLMLKFRMLHRIFELHLFQGLQQLCSKIFDPLAKNFYTANNAATALEKRFISQISAVERLLDADK